MVAELVHAARLDPATGIIMPQILYYDNKSEIWSAGGRYRAFPPAILLQDKEIMRSEQIRMIEYAPSCGLLIHRQAFEKAGLFDPGYFFLFDDWDFSERVRAHGLHIYYNPDAKMWHKVSKTLKDSHKSFYWKTFGESMTRFYRRHGKPVWFSLPVHVSYIFLRDMIFHRNWIYSSDFIDGVRAGLQKPMGPFPTVATK
jgi:GT2 family glycosyltransferase